MAEVSEYRRSNFRRLVERLGGPLETAAKLDMGASQVSQLISPRIAKNMGTRLARRIEETAGVPKGSLDLPATTDGMKMIPIPVVTNDDLKKEYLWSSIEGATEQKEVVYDRSNPYRPIGPLVAVYLPDNAMSGTANQDDLMIFDCWPAQSDRQDEVAVGSVVLLRHEGKLAARMMKQSAQGGFDFVASSDLFAPIHKPDASDILGVLIEVRWLKPRAPI